MNQNPESKNTTKNLTQMAAMVAITVFFGFVGNLIPIVDVMSYFIIPVPIVIIMMRINPSAGVKVAVASSLLLLILVPFPMSIGIVARFVIIGLSMGYAFYHRYSGLKTLTIGTGAAALSIAVYFAMALWVMGINPIEEMFTMMMTMVETTRDTLLLVGQDAAMVETIIASYTEVLDFIPLILPIILVGASMTMSAFNFLIVKGLLKRFKIEVAKFPRLLDFYIPKKGAYLAIGFMLVAMVLNDFLISNESVYTFYLNVLTAVGVLFTLGGIITCYEFLRSRRFSKGFTLVVIIVLMMTPLGTLFLYVGIFDSLMDLRHKNKPKTQREE